MSIGPAASDNMDGFAGRRDEGRRAVLARSAVLGKATILILAVILFVPKIDILSVPGFTVTAKPEDLVWLLVSPVCLLWRPKVAGLAAIAWWLLLGYVAVSALWFASNAILAVRLFFYSLPFAYAVFLNTGQRRSVALIIKVFLFVLAVTALLQKTFAVPLVHTGEFLLGPTDRPSGIFGNAVEFSLVGLMCFWILILLGERRIWPWVAAFSIAWLSGTRMVMAALLVSTLAYLDIRAIVRLAGVVLAATLVSILVLLFQSESDGSRLAEINPRAVFAALADVFAYVRPNQMVVSDTEGYCFEFDDSLADDQSLAMRLSKMLFVLENVVLGSHRMGFGLGRCIGDAGDNLYVRVLSDAGIPLFLSLIFFFSMLLFVRVQGRLLRRNWRMFVLVLMGVSFFYDTLYLSRVAPLVFIAIALVAFRHPVRPSLRRPDMKANELAAGNGVAPTS